MNSLLHRTFFIKSFFDAIIIEIEKLILLSFEIENLEFFL